MALLRVRTQDRELGGDIVHRAVSFDRRLVDDLHRVDLLCLAVRALVALCKAALSKKLSFDIPLECKLCDGPRTPTPSGSATIAKRSNNLRIC